jgi:ABC-type Fe3+-hydroxamate transport system substrate-binding protein
MRAAFLLGGAAVAALVACDQRLDHFAGVGAPGADDAGAPVLTSLGVNIGALSPEFAPSTAGYVVAVDSNVTTIAVTATAGPGTTIAVNGTTVSSGASSGPILLAQGDTPITVTVSNGTSIRTYTLLVTRVGGSSAVNAGSGDLLARVNGMSVRMT